MNDPLDLWEINDPVTEFDIDVPAWIDQDITPHTVAAICHGGCESGAYMPAVTYYMALETMQEHGDDVLDYLAENDPEPRTLDPLEETWATFTVSVLSAAVEAWASDTENELDEIIERDVETIRNHWLGMKAAVEERFGSDDEIALNEAFSNTTDQLCKDGEITDWSYANIVREQVET